MPLDLKLLPLNDILEHTSIDVLSFHRDDRLFGLIRIAESKQGLELDKPLVSYFGNTTGGYGFGETKVDMYGDPLKYLLAHDLQESLKGIKVLDFKNRAIISFINECPGDLKFYLYWN